MEPKYLFRLPFFADMTLSNYYLPALILFFETTARSVTLLLVAHFFLAGFYVPARPAIKTFFPGFIFYQPNLYFLRNFSELHG